MIRKKILLVDDANTILMMEKMILGKSGFDLIVAKNGQEAVTKSVSEKPDLILMDVNMPKMNGFEACQKIRANESTKSIPIIMVTTRGEMENRKIGFENGCTDYVTKPINGPELMSKIKSFLAE